MPFVPPIDTYLPPHAHKALTTALARWLPDCDRPDREAVASEILAYAGIWDARVLDDPDRGYEISRTNVRTAAT